MKCKRWRGVCMYMYVCMYVYIYICIYIRLFYRGEPISDQRGLHHARLFICAHLLLLERVLRATRRRSSAGINSEKFFFLNTNRIGLVYDAAAQA